MKIARTALVAVLGLPCAAQAEIITNPGPYRMPKTEIGCQNLMDKQDLEGYQVLKNPRGVEEVMRKQSGPNAELTKGLCLSVPKGVTVTVRDRWISKECVDIKERPSTHCFWVENVSGKKREDKSPYPWSSYY